MKFAPLGAPLPRLLPWTRTNFRGDAAKLGRKNAAGTKLLLEQNHRNFVQQSAVVRGANGCGI
jgi:hypothetical protein